MVPVSAMDNASLERLLRARLPGLDGRAGLWQAEVDDLLVYVVTDEANDRVRIMIPVGEVGPSDSDLLWMLLAANFDRALDAKYAINEGVLWCVFLHRLSWLTETELDAALQQVITLARNTGTSFASGDLVFGDADDER